MSDRETERREAIAEVARDFHETAKRAGNTDLTFDQARERVSQAVRSGDRKRDNDNR